MPAFAVAILLTASMAVILQSGDGEAEKHEPSFDLHSSADQFIPVTGVTGVPTLARVGVPLTFTGTVIPFNATNNTISWSVKDAGTTGASISGNTMTATGAGTVTVTATIEGVSNFADVSAGYHHTMAIRTDGTLWAWGRNASGQLGDGTGTDRHAPVQIGTANDWKSVSVGYEHTAAIKTNGELWVWGANRHGQLGNGNNVSSNEPIRIGTNDWAYVSAGYHHTAAIKTNGELWSWGQNNHGKLGDGTAADRNNPVPVQPGTTWASVSAGGEHTAAIRTNGTMWAWGNNHYGQLGDGTTANRNSPVQVSSGTIWNSVSSGSSHTMAINTAGQLFAWGSNGNGQLGNGTTTNSHAPVGIGTANDWAHVSAGQIHTAAIKTNGELWTWGHNQYGQLGDGSFAGKNNPVRVGTANDWVSVSAGGFHTVAVKLNGELLACGYNDYGQLGDSTVTTRNTPIQIGTGVWAYVSAGSNHTVAVKANGELWAWGSNDQGQLGLGNSGFMTNRNVPTQVGTATDWKTVSAGWGYTMAVKENGTLWAWGNNQYGQLGLGNSGFNTHRTVPTQVGTATDWKMVSAGTGYTMAVKENGTLWAWGWNFHGQLGLGNFGAGTNRLVPAQLGADTDWSFVAAGNSHTVAIKTNGELWTWGDGWSGQLGLGDNDDRLTPVRVGTDLWKSVSIGTGHTVAVNTKGELWTWGMNSSGQLGNGTAASNNAPVRIGTATDWAHTSAGHSHTIAIRTDGTMWAWGENRNGQFGNGTGVNSNVPVRVGTENDWASIMIGVYHSAGIRINGELHVWGSNISGQLGDGTTVTKITPVKVVAAADYLYRSIHYEESFTITVVSSNAYAVAYNLNGGTGITPATAHILAGTTLSVALTTNITPPSNKYFAEWNTLANGNGTSYAAGSAVTMPSNAFTLHAIWGDAVLFAAVSSDEWADVSSEGFTITVNETDPKDLLEVRVNGVPITSSNYEKSEAAVFAGNDGGTTVKIHSAYLKTLGTGTHNFDLKFKYGEGYKIATAALTIPATDMEIPITLIAIAAIAAIGAACLIMFIRGRD